MSAKKVKYAGKKTVLTYEYLQIGARYLLELAEKTSEGNLYTSMMSLVGTAFFLEAYLNHLGATLLPYWGGVERSLSPHAKLALLCHYLNIEPDFGKCPYQSFRKVFDFRNLMAHGKTETVRGEWRSSLGHAHAMSMLETKWEKMCSPKEARQCYEDGKKIVEQLHAKAGLRGKPFTTMATMFAGTK
jgi:hypothetical protein